MFDYLGTGFLLPIVIVMVVVLGLVGYVFIRTPANFWLKWTLIPSLLAAALFSSSLFVSKLGYAVPMPLPEQAQVLSYNIVLEDNQKKWIELWLKEGSASRLFVVPYSKENEKELKDGADKAKKGGKHMLKKNRPNGKKGKGKGDIEGPQPDFYSDILVPSQEITKDGVQPEPEVEEAPDHPEPQRMAPGVREA